MSASEPAPREIAPRSAPLRVVETVFHWGPLIFAALFLWPLVAQSLAELGVDMATATWIGAVLALPLGVAAQWRGRWV